MSIQHLDQLNYSVGELITYQNRQSLQTEQLRTVSKTLLNQIKRHQQLLDQLQDQTNRQANLPVENRPTSHSKSSSRAARRARKNRPSNPLIKNEATTSNLTQSLLDHTIQLSETAAAVDLLTDQANRLLEKQQQLLISTQNALIEARMLPLSEIFGRFPNTLQQLETLHNKPIALKLEGAEVLVDKAVAEKLFDPLLHLVRNAFDHGIEPTAIRQQRGKPEKGQITLSAYHQGRRLVIEVQDDGNGLEFDQIRQRAIDREKLSIDQATLLTQEQLANLLFEPGFSTASQVSDLSGRGIGLDVVRSQLNALRGSVTVRSTPQQGTTFTLQIPLNLTIAQLLVCEVESKIYALLDDAVEQILIPRANQIQERNGGKFLHWSQGTDETLIPIFSLTQVLNYQSATPASKSPSFGVSNDLANPIILIHCQDHLLGLAVDRLMGEQKLVIRPLGTLLESPDYVHGASTLADGRLALVIDPAMLLQKKIVPTPDPTNSSYWATNLLPTSNQALLQPQFPFLGSSTPALSPQSNTRILVIDDSITTRQSIVFVLEKAGYQVFQAQDGQEGMNWFQHHANIQLVICDIDMPRMNGFEFLRQRQQIPALAAIPVLMLSSQSGEKHQLLALQLGATVYMVKPFMEPKLLAIVTRLLEQASLSAMTE
ncbi:hybrid sensor histidine kinase/response regulator [Phormidesmis priestleyi]